MPVELGQHFSKHLAGVENALARLDEATASQTYRANGWTRKQVVGHLIDSALNNHQRFIRAAIDGAYQGPGYARHWTEQNRLLAAVVQRIPEDRLQAQCAVGDGGPVTLQFLIEDYLRHIDHHLSQIVQSA
jgi:hypothetical protein